MPFYMQWNHQTDLFHSMDLSFQSATLQSIAIPEGIQIQYDQVYNNAASVTLDTVRQAVTEDYQRRPNELDLFGQGPGPIGLKNGLASFGDTFTRSTQPFLDFWVVLGK